MAVFRLCSRLAPLNTSLGQKRLARNPSPIDEGIRITKTHLTEWAESLLHMNHPATLVQREIEVGNLERASHLAERARKRAWRILNELFEHGAEKPKGYAEPEAQMISNEEIDRTLMAHVTNRWRKVASVVGGAMMELGEKRQGRDDLYFAARVAFLAVRGVIEYEDDLGQMGRCEVRLPQAKA
jgi:hypothetical protein